MRQPFVVGVEQGDPGLRRVGQARVASRAEALVDGVAHHPSAGGPGDLGGVVRGAVVDDQDFGGPRRLLFECAPHRPGHGVGPVVGRDDHRDRQRGACATGLGLVRAHRCAAR